MSAITRIRDWLLRIPLLYAAVAGFTLCVLAPICVEPLGEAGILIAPFFLTAWFVTCVLVFIHACRALSGSTHRLVQFAAPVFVGLAFIAVTFYAGGAIGFWVVHYTGIPFKP